MSERHYKKELAAFIDHEFSKNDQQEIGEHLLRCGDCRQEHDRIKLGSQLAAKLPQADARARLWSQIEDALEGKSVPRMALIERAGYFGRRNLIGYAVALLLVTGLVSAVYLTLFRADLPSRETKRANQPANVIRNDTPISPEVAAVPANSSASTPSANTEPLVANSNEPAVESAQIPEQVPAASWPVETVSGTPTFSTPSSKDRLGVGEVLETDAASRARITVANIGNVEIEPNSRVRLVGTTTTEHRLSLERGVLQAKISAPPRLFIVDTPSAAAVDLGCEYRLEVDKAGNSHLYVARGFVSLERGGRESLVPAGAMCITKRGRGLGTPYSAETSDAFRVALERFDFGGGGSTAVKDMLATRNFYDMVTLWHLLSRVGRADREKVYDALAAYVKPPS